MTDIFKQAKDKCDPILRSLRDKEEGSEYVPGTLMHWLDVLVGWLPNLGSEASDAFYTWKTQEAKAYRVRSNEYNRLVEGGMSVTPAGERARQNPQYITELEALAVAHADHNRIQNYRDDVKEAIYVVKAELKSLNSDWSTTSG